MIFRTKASYSFSMFFFVQAMAFAGFTHSCQLELSKALRKALSRDEANSGLKHVETFVDSMLIQF